MAEATQAPTSFLEIVGDDLTVLHVVGFCRFRASPRNDKLI